MGCGVGEGWVRVRWGWVGWGGLGRTVGGVWAVWVGALWLGWGWVVGGPGVRCDGAEGDLFLNEASDRLKALHVFELVGI